MPTIELDVPLEKVQQLTEVVIQDAVNQMLDYTLPVQQQESQTFVLFLLNLSLGEVHQRISDLLGQKNWTATIPGVSLDIKLQGMLLTPFSAEDEPAAPIKLANYLWATVSGRDEC